MGLGGNGVVHLFPTTDRAWLVCEGECSDGGDVWTRHHMYSRSVSIRRGYVDGVETLYRCDRCGVSRRWGYDRPMSEPVEED